MIDDIEDKESELECLKQLLSESNKHIPTYQPVRSD